MPTINITPDKAIQEMMDFTQKLGKSFKNLLNAEEITTGVTLKEIIYQEDKMILYRFIPEVTPVKKPIPVLIVYALVNRPYMTDIQEDRSTVRGLLNEGLDVYLIDWGYPDGADQYLSMDDYINGYLDRCVDVIRKRHAMDKINLLGICQGGTFSLCYSSLHTDKIKNLVTMVTPVDFHTPDNLLSRWYQNIDVDLLVDTMGNIPGEMLNYTFLSLKPYRLMGQKYLDMVDVLDDPETAKNFLRMEKWIFDSPDQAGETFRQFTKDFYHGNKLIKGEVQLGEQTVSLNNITMPVLNIYALQDHLVPPSATRPLKDYVGSGDYEELAFKGGHVGIYVSGRAQQTIPKAIGDWLNKRSK
ncbi:MAG: class III poly(R)-hydroxyalkanoic acid synthase subunit PhaC [Methylobacter sp.]|nr:class III poly(R)-hydroxyalkanoic acid synthase subunit PhaC [Methylobacter sp.]